MLIDFLCKNNKLNDVRRGDLFFFFNDWRTLFTSVNDNYEIKTDATDNQNTFDTKQKKR